MKKLLKSNVCHNKTKYKQKTIRYCKNVLKLAMYATVNKAAPDKKYNIFD